MVITALPVLTGDGLTWAETFLDTGMHLTPYVTPTKQWRPVIGATYMAANSLMQTAQSLIRGVGLGRGSVAVISPCQVRDAIWYPKWSYGM